MPLCLKVCKLGCGSIEAPSRGEPKPGPLGPDFYSIGNAESNSIQLKFLSISKGFSLVGKYATRSFYKSFS